MRVRVRDLDMWFDVIACPLGEDAGNNDDRPTVVMLHGALGDHSAGMALAAKLSRIARVIMLDQRGHGQSSLSDASYWNLATWADDIAGFCAVLGIERPIIYGGSFGSMVALQIAIRHPQLASKYILSAAAARENNERRVAAFRKFGGDLAANTFVRFSECPHDATARAAFLQTCLPLMSRSLGQAVAAMKQIGNSGAEPWAHFSRPGGELSVLDLRPALQGIGTPTLLLAGALDPSVPVETARETFDSFAPGVARLEVLEDASHTISLDQPERFVELVKDFIFSSEPVSMVI